MKDLAEAINKISTVLEIFFKEYFLHFIFSIILTVVLYYFMPVDNKILLKLGNFIFYGTAFLIFFLITYFIIRLYKRINEKIYYFNQKKIYEENLERKNIQEIRNFIDKLTREDRKIIDYFVQNNNKPLIIQGYLVGNYLLEYYCDKNEFEVQEKIKSHNPISLKEECELEPGMIATKYKLKKDLYEPLRIMKERNISISNFD